jgi:hypothetical protein
MDAIKIRDTKQSTHNINEAFVADTIFDSIIEELKLESKRGDYSMNFNPNWFFIFYKELG